MEEQVGAIWHRLVTRWADNGHPQAAVRLSEVQRSGGEHVNVDRSSDDEEDADHAEAVARDIDGIALGKDNRTSATRIKFDLDLPSAAEDDRVVGEPRLDPPIVDDYCHWAPIGLTPSALIDAPHVCPRSAQPVYRDGDFLTAAHGVNPSL